MSCYCTILKPSGNAGDTYKASEGRGWRSGRGLVRDRDRLHVALVAQDVEALDNASGGVISRSQIHADGGRVAVDLQG